MDNQVEKDWVSEVLKTKYEADEILAVEVQPAIGENQNFGSSLFRLTVKMRTKSEEIESKHVILKTKSCKKSSYSDKEEELLFDLENKVYSELLQKMEQLIKKESKEREILWPRYLGHKQLNLLMEDLVQDSFELYPKEKPLDENHTHAVMRVYGRFHGLGQILAQRNQVPIEKFRTHLITGDVMVMPKFYTSGMQALLNVMPQWGPEWTNIIPEMRNAGENIWQKLKDLALLTEETGPCVINHGDCWTNNILFKYDSDSSTPKQIRLVDFQFCHFNSPAWDLTYFFYNALLPRERFDKMQDYLKTYTDSLAETLKSFSFKGKILSTNDILTAVQSLAYYGLVNAVTIRPLLIASTDKDFVYEPEKLLDDYPGGPQSVHKPSFYSSQQTHDILKEEIKLYLKLKK